MKGQETTSRHEEGASAFVGSWKCTEIRGDHSRLLKAQDVPWAARRAARMHRYGKGREEEYIDVTGEWITITNNCIGYYSPVTNDFRLMPSSKQEMRSVPQGNPMSAQVNFTDDVMSVEYTSRDGWRSVTTRSMEGDKMLVSTSVSAWPKGKAATSSISATRVYTRLCERKCP